MKKQSFYSIFMLFFLFSCDKEIIDIELTPIDQQRLVVEGHFTDSLQKNTFTITWTQRLGSQTPSYASNIDLSIITPSGTEIFEEIGPGTYQSQHAFKGEYGENYRIEFNKDGLTHFREIQMPQPVEIPNVQYDVFDSASYSTTPLAVDLYITSPVEQYLRYTLSSADLSGMGEDTAWFKLPLPIYNVTRVPMGDSILVKLSLDNDNLNQAFYGLLLKIELEVITSEVGEYLQSLKNYSTNATQEGKLLNPPYYYSNEAYGLGYGAITYEIIHKY